AVDLRSRHALPYQVVDAATGALHQQRHLAELDAVGRTCFGAGRLETIGQALVAERALVGFAVKHAQVGHAERAGRHAVAAPVADVLLDHHGIEFGADDGAGRAGLHAAGPDAVLADVAQHQPAALERRLAEGRRVALESL